MQYSIIKCTVCFSSYKVKMVNIKYSALLLDSYTHTNSFLLKTYCSLYTQILHTHTQTHCDFCHSMQQYSILASLQMVTHQMNIINSVLQFYLQSRSTSTFFLQKSDGFRKYITNRSKVSCGDLLGRLWLTVYRIMNISKQPAASTPSDHTITLPEDNDPTKLFNNTINT